MNHWNKILKFLPNKLARDNVAKTSMFIAGHPSIAKAQEVQEIEAKEKAAAEGKEYDPDSEPPPLE